MQICCTFETNISIAKHTNEAKVTLSNFIIIALITYS